MKPDYNHYTAEGAIQHKQLIDLNANDFAVN